MISGINQFFCQLEHTNDMIAVNMANHQEIDGEWHVTLKAARLS